MAMAYTAQYRASMVQRLTGPAAVSAHELSRQTGIAQSTLSKWLSEARTLPEMTTHDDDAVTPRKERTPEEKLRLINEASQLSGEELGAFLRREGVHEVELRDWTKDVLNALNGVRARPATPGEKRRIAELERELRRKDKALAEAAALVLLKKKAQALGLLPPDDEDNGQGGSSGSSS
jgi:transposase